MTTKPPQSGLHVLPGGCLTPPPVTDLRPMIPVEAWTATDAWAERLSDATLAALVSEHVHAPILTWPGGELDRLTWRKLADVLLTELLRRVEAPAP